MNPSSTIIVNGEIYPVLGDPLTPLVRFLRESVHLTGTKYACGEGFCGSCTVLIDGSAAASCLTPVSAVSNRSIRTIESIEPSDSVLAALQAAFVDDDVVQCGMCFPGMVMALAGLLSTNPRPSREEVEAGLSGNLCRCTGYSRLLDTVTATLKRLGDIEELHS
ncbi:(2Fe-2S)-binding protein [Rhodococcus sp. NPDC079359]|uniref:(2Fe-2S)-binding protein n=1 Tax=Rhodococcus sp. NPDC079359 TaxID=3154961 RepID=UPI00344D0863